MSINLSSTGIIPARYASTRFPGKPLTDIAGKSMIQRVYEQVSRSDLDKVMVATDDERIFEAVRAFGGEVMMTGRHHNGTSRCREAFLQMQDSCDIMVNIQGDEPFIQPSQINAVLKAFEAEDTEIATLCKRISEIGDLMNPDIVKVVLSDAIREDIYNALYFSRSAIPFVRDYPQNEWMDNEIFYKHIGLYAFRRSFLTDSYPALKAGKLEKSESLEQLRWLENGFDIRILQTEEESINIDRPEDVQRALKWLKTQI